MSSNRTIQRLTTDLKRVKRPASAKASVALWFGLSALIVAALLLVAFSIRSDLEEVSSQFWFIMNGIALVLIFISASYVGFVMAIPGRAKPKWALLALQLSLIGFFFTFFPSLLEMPLWRSFQVGLNPASGIKCSMAIVFLGFIPAVLFFFSIRRLAPVKPGAVGRMIGLSMGAMGALGLSFECMVQNPFHLIIYHGLPMLFLGAIGIYLGERLLKW